MNQDNLMQNTEAPMQLQEVFQKLEEIIGRMEQPDTGLEDSFRCYREGMKLVAYAHGTIDGIEKQLITLEEEAGKQA